MQINKSIYELSSDEYLRGRIEFLRNKVKEFRLEIKRMEDLLHASETGALQAIENNPKQLTIQNSEVLDFSVTYWKPKVFDFLFENTAQYTSEQILIGSDVNKDYQKNKDDRNKAIKSISSSLFLLSKEDKVSKHENSGRRGFKWSVKEPGS